MKYIPWGGHAQKTPHKEWRQVESTQGNIVEDEKDREDEKIDTHSDVVQNDLEATIKLSKSEPGDSVIQAKQKLAFEIYTTKIYRFPIPP